MFYNICERYAAETWEVAPGDLFLHHTSIPAHSALCRVQQFLASSAMTIVLPPLYTTYSAPCDFLTVPQLRLPLKVRHLVTSA
jgi:hypothetical protein